MELEESRINRRKEKGRERKKSCPTNGKVERCASFF